MRVNKLSTLLAVATAVLLVAGVQSAVGARTKSQARVVVSARTLPGLGKILVNGAGRTLYMFVPDKRARVTCHRACAKVWPPLYLKGTKAVAAGGVKASLLGSDPDSTGGRVVTYNHWPLYLYLGDPKAGVAYGQAINQSGGLWYVLSVSGAVIKVKPHSGGGGGGGGGGTTTTTTTTGGGGGGGCADDDGDGDASAGGPDDGDGCI